MYEVYAIEEDNVLKQLDGYEYWNNEEEERTKEFDVRDGNFLKLEEYLEETGLSADLSDAIERSGLKDKKSITGVELASGVCWTSPIVFENLEISRMDYLEFSDHRIRAIAPLILEHYKIPNDRVRLYRGSFYNTGFQDNSYDFVLLSQALHHAEYVGELLREIRRILKDNGVVLVVGEPYFGGVDALKIEVYLSITSLLFPKREQSKLFRQDRCLRYDEILGDRVYSYYGYKKIFSKYGFVSKQLKAEESRTFILRKYL